MNNEKKGGGLTQTSLADLGRREHWSWKPQYRFRKSMRQHFRILAIQPLQNSTFAKKLIEWERRSYGNHGSKKIRSWCLGSPLQLSSRKCFTVISITATPETEGEEKRTRKKKQLSKKWCFFVIFGVYVVVWCFFLNPRQEFLMIQYSPGLILQIQ